VYDNKTGLAVNTPKSYGKSIKAAQLIEGISRFFPVDGDVSDQGTFGLPRATLLPIIQAIREEIAEVREVLSTLEFRMVGGSVLVIYEADWDRAEAGIKKHLEGAPQNGEAEDAEEGDDDEEEKKENPPFKVKLIDFAHTRIEEGLGSDEGVLLGLETVLRLLDERIGQITNA